jgi:hypothetical protein
LFTLFPPYLLKVRQIINLSSENGNEGKEKVVGQSTKEVNYHSPACLPAGGFDRPWLVDGIQSFQGVLDCPVKPDNDKEFVGQHTSRLLKKSAAINKGCHTHEAYPRRY